MQVLQNRIVKERRRGYVLKKTGEFLNKGCGIGKILNFLKCFILPLIIYLIFAIGSGGRFGSAGTMYVLLKQCIFPCLIAWSISFVMQMGVFDLSPGTVIVLAGIIGGNIAQITGTGLAGMILFTVLAGMALTLITCTVFVFTRLPSLIVSLGMLMIYETLTMLLFDGRGVSIPTEWRALYQEPYVFLVLAGAFLAFYFLHNFTQFGYQVRALGNGTQISMNIGVKLTKTRYLAFLIEGIFLGLASVMDMSITGSEVAVTSMASCSTAFSAIMAVMVGQYLSKYCSMLLGTLIGAFSLKIIASGMLAFGWSAQMQKVGNGIFLIVFIGISQNLTLLLAQKEKKQRKRRLEREAAAAQMTK